jgi:hypothetical protein
MAKLTLLDKAMSRPNCARTHEDISDEQIDVALAWMEGTITGSQATYALGHTNRANTQARFAVILREAYRRGKLKVVR